MAKNLIISASKANQLYWLGRYQERVYMTLHFLRKCYDQMIDGNPESYHTLREMLDPMHNYPNNEEFALGMVYDETNPSSVFSALNRAMDNAILLREDIYTETLSYIEMSIALMKLAFWGSAEQRIYNTRILNIMMIGRHVEFLDMMLRYSDDFKRISLAYRHLKKYLNELPASVDSDVAGQLDALIVEEAFDLSDVEYRQKVAQCINKMIKI